MSFAVEYPDRINKLVVVDIAPRKYPANSEHKMLIDATRLMLILLGSTRDQISEAA